jgi:putative transcriptional regulator
MSELFESIQQGLKEAIDFAQGQSSTAIVHEFAPIDIKAIRANVGMSQAEFATIFGVSLGTLRHWEQGEKQPEGPALMLLQVVAKEPEAVLRALHYS